MFIYRESAESEKGIYGFLNTQTSEDVGKGSFDKSRSWCFWPEKIKFCVIIFIFIEVEREEAFYFI